MASRTSEGPGFSAGAVLVGSVAPPAGPGGGGHDAPSGAVLGLLPGPKRGGWNAMSAAKKQAYTYDYPRPAVTVDLVLVTREEVPRVLLVRRKHAPFEGAWALPGGFVDPDETLEEAARRELKEEAGLRAGRLEQLRAFGDPGRD